jgi:hypothetical protein
MRDLWTWCAIYKDGGALYEYDEDGTEHGFREVKPDQVEALCLLPSSTEQKSYEVKVDPTKVAPVFFRRRSIHIRSDGEEGGRSVIHCIGWEGRNKSSYLFVFEDGSTLLTDDLNAV